MSTEADVVGYLEGVAGLTALIGAGDASRLYPLKVPQGCTMPALTYKLVSAGRTYTHDDAVASAPFASPRYQFNVWADNYDQADGVLVVAAQLRAALSGYAGTIGGTRYTAKVANEIDDRDPPTGYFVRAVDVVLEHQEV